MNSKTKGISRAAVVTILGVAALLLSGCGRGYYGHMMGPGGQRGGYHGNLPTGETAKLDQQHLEFSKATEGMRRQLYAKEQVLRSELAKENPDTSKASGLQGEISKLRSDLDQIRLDYEIRAGRSGRNYNRGPGGHGSMRGYDHRGGEYCMW